MDSHAHGHIHGHHHVVTEIPEHDHVHTHGQDGMPGHDAIQGHDVMQGHGHVGMDMDGDSHDSMGHGMMGGDSHSGMGHRMIGGDSHGDMGNGMMGGDSHGGMGHGMMGMMDMKMPDRWFTAKTEYHFLIENLKIDSVAGISIAIVATVVLFLLFEAINFSLNQKHAAAKNRKDSSLLSMGLHTLLKMLSVSLGYIIMLVVMTFNGWMMVAAVTGAGIAHLVLRPALYMCFRCSQSDTCPSNYKCGATRGPLCDDVTDVEKDILLTHSATTISNNVGDKLPLSEVSPLVSS